MPWLTRGGDGFYVLSSRTTIKATVAGTSRIGLYPRPGEWLWHPHLCPDGIRRMMGSELPVGIGRRVKFTMLWDDDTGS